MGKHSDERDANAAEQTERAPPHDADTEPAAQHDAKQTAERSSEQVPPNEAMHDGDAAAHGAADVVSSPAVNATRPHDARGADEWSADPPAPEPNPPDTAGADESAMQGKVRHLQAAYAEVTAPPAVGPNVAATLDSAWLRFAIDPFRAAMIGAGISCVLLAVFQALNRELGDLAPLGWMLGTFVGVVVATRFGFPSKPSHVGWYLGRAAAVIALGSLMVALAVVFVESSDMRLRRTEGQIGISFLGAVLAFAGRFPKRRIPTSTPAAAAVPVQGVDAGVVRHPARALDFAGIVVFAILAMIPLLGKPSRWLERVLERAADAPGGFPIVFYAGVGVAVFLLVALAVHQRRWPERSDWSHDRWLYWTPPALVLLVTWLANALWVLGPASTRADDLNVFEQAPVHLSALRGAGSLWGAACFVGAVLLAVAAIIHGRRARSHVEALLPERRRIVLLVFAVVAAVLAAIVVEAYRFDLSSSKRSQVAIALIPAALGALGIHFGAAATSAAQRASDVVRRRVVADQVAASDCALFAVLLLALGRALAVDGASGVGDRQLGYFIGCALYALVPLLAAATVTTRAHFAWPAFRSSALGLGALSAPLLLVAVQFALAWGRWEEVKDSFIPIGRWY